MLLLWDSISIHQQLNNTLITKLSFQVAHFVTPFNYDNLASIHAALNGLLPSDIRVREISPAVPEFHARFSAKSKVYHYKIYNDSIMDPFQRRYAYHSTYKLNTALMREAASYFVGKHDFSAFVNASHNDGVPDPVKTIFRFDVIEMVIVKPHRWSCINEICFTSELHHLFFLIPFQLDISQKAHKGITITCVEFS